jgi:hypothetical protein
VLSVTWITTAPERYESGRGALRRKLRLADIPLPK